MPSTSLPEPTQVSTKPESLRRSGKGTPKYWIDGRLVSADKASLPLTDLAVTRGYGAFEAFRTYSGVPFLLHEHLVRMERTCRLLGLTLPLSVDGLASAVLETLDANDIPDALVRIYLTGGDASGFLPEGRERLLILIGPAKVFPAWQYEEGVKLKSTTLGRMIPFAKSLDYTVGVRETLLAARQGYDEVVFVNEAGHLLEGTQFNVLAVVGQRVITPKASVLSGITAGHVLQLARRNGLKASYGPLTPEILQQSSEILITSSNREIIPAVRLDRKKIGSGRPGPIGKLLLQRFRRGIADLTAHKSHLSSSESSSTLLSV